MRISDWSSDVCSSDLLARLPRNQSYRDGLAQPLDQTARMSQHTVGINISVKLQNEDLVFGYRRIVRPGTLDNGPARLESKTGLACYSLVRQAAKRRERTSTRLNSSR